MQTSIVLVSASFVWLFVAILLRKQHSIHAAMMMVLLVFDLLFPVYLYATHDWYLRLVTHKELLSFAIWAHLLFVLSLYAVYVLQILSGKKMKREPAPEREAHQMQARVFVILRLFVFTSGALLMESIQ